MPASLSPLARSSTCFWNRCFWSMGSFSSEKALPISLRQMNSSNRSVRRGSLGDRLARGLTSTGCMVMKVGWISFSSTFWSKVSYRALPQVGSAVSGSSTPMDLAAATASASPLMAMKSMPVYCFTASAMVIRGQPGVRSICSPCHSTW